MERTGSTLFFCIIMKRIKSLEIDDTSLDPYISVIEDRHAYIEVCFSSFA